MPADSPERPKPPEGIRKHVAVGRYDLILGDSAGTTLIALESSNEPSQLAQAIARARAEQEASQAGDNAVEDAISDATEVADKIEHAADLFAKIAQGRVDAKFVSEQVDVLTELLKRLDTEGRWQETLRLARVLAMLLALLERWMDLIESLRTAVRVAEHLGDESVRAWALHELGTLHLAAERLPEADNMLSRSRELREQLGDRRGLRVTESNLSILCQTLRDQLHPTTDANAPFPPRWITMLGIAIVPLIVGGAAGAVIRGSGDHGRKGSSLASKGVAEIALTPSKPRTNETVAFRAAADGVTADDRYSWSFGDTHHGAGAHPSHTYRHPDDYSATVTIRNAQGVLIARGARTVHVLAKPGRKEITTTSTQTTTPEPTSTLTVTKAGEGAGTITTSDGALTCTTECTHTYSTGTPLTLTANHSEGSEFTGWGGDCSGSEGESCQLTMSRDKTVTATFETEKVTLTVERSGSGKGTVSSNDDHIDCGTQCSYEYEKGASVQLSATPERGPKGEEPYVFSGWSGACESDACALTLNRDAVVVASFNTKPR